MKLGVEVCKLGLPIGSWSWQVGVRVGVLEFCSQFQNWRFSLASCQVDCEILVGHQTLAPKNLREAICTPNSGGSLCHWGCHSLCHLTKWVMECWGVVHVLSTVPMACPDQARSLQGFLDVSRGHLAANDLGTGSGWQQSKQN